MFTLSRTNIKKLSVSVMFATATLATGCVTTSSAPATTGASQMSAGEAANANFKDTMSNRQLLKALKGGGYVIYFRHAATEKDYADQVTAVMGNCSTQRTLSQTGWNDAIRIGNGFNAYGIPFNDVISSQYCRAWQTAQIAFGKYVQNGDLNFPKSEDYSDAQVAQMKARLDPMLNAVPPRGTNTIIVGHDDLFEASTGIYPDPQGIAYVVKPHGNGTFSIVANVLPHEWAKLGQ